MYYTINSDTIFWLSINIKGLLSLDHDHDRQYSVLILFIYSLIQQAN